MRILNLKKKLKKWSEDLFPINRSLTGSGNLTTLKYIKKNINSKLKIKKVASGTRCFDWRIPKEWNVTSAMLKSENGDIIADFSRNNLELMGYSTPVNKWVSYKNLKPHLFTLKKKPNAIPYVTSYYNKNWGFCLKYNKFKKLDKKKKYFVEIKSQIKKGYMHYGEIFIKGKSKKEILITSYICHPSMANNELSGILASSLISKMIRNNKYSVRILLISETIGAIFFIKKYFKHLKSNLVAGINLTCVGISGPYTIISSINENSYADLITSRIGAQYNSFKKLSFKFRGSNERQFGCQNLGLPFVTFCRKRYGEYKEYHTSLDNLKIINYNEIINSVNFVVKVINEINQNSIFIKKQFCELFLTKYNLISSIGTEANRKIAFRKHLSNYLAYISRSIDLKELAKITQANIFFINKLTAKLLKIRLIQKFF
jgi:aminopeptidase-like protein